MNSNFRNFIVWVFIGLLLLALFNLFQSDNVQVRGNEISFSQLLSEVESGRVQDVTIAGNKITGHFADGRNFYASPACRWQGFLFSVGCP